MAEVELRRRSGPSLWAQVDDADLPTVGTFRWHAQASGNVTYAVRHTRRPDGRKSTQGMHVLLLGPGVDHVDGDGLNNHRSNLRPADRRQNGQNRSKNRGTTSAYKGVSWYRSLSKWRAAITVDGRVKHLGYFTDERDAARAYDDAARLAFGDYARLNLTEAHA